MGKKAAWWCFSLLLACCCTRGRSDNEEDALQPKDGTVRQAGGSKALRDAPFTPEIYVGGSYHPICFTENNGASVASAVCAAVGLPYGGSVVKKTGETYDTNAISVPVKCDLELGEIRERMRALPLATQAGNEKDYIPQLNALRDQYIATLANCIIDGNEFGERDVAAQCRAGQPIGVEIICNFQCRAFGSFDVELEACHPYLDNSTQYYLADSHWWDNKYISIGFSLTQQLASIFETAMNPPCAANMVALFCHTLFKECKQTTSPTGSHILAPSLLCRSECERHREIWDTCLVELEKDAEAKADFDTLMQEAVDGQALAALIFYQEALPAGPDNTRTPYRMMDCDSPGGDLANIPAEDSALASMNGQWPVPRGNDISTFGVDPEYYYVPYATSSIHFPENVDTAALYPEKSFEYTLFDGTVRDVQCFIPGEAKEAARFECPQPFVNPIDDNHVESCIQPCPVQAYTDEEYSVMWAISNGIGIIGLSLNLFMTCTWMIAGKRIRSKLPYQLKFCVFAGLLFGMLGTLPSLMLKYDLPCECDTEECTGTSTVCAINRASIYILLSILINLCALTFKLAHAIVGSKRRLHQGTLNFFCTAIPILLAILGYALEGGSNEGENSKLNTARHAFSCSMRFDDMETEWLLLWCHFLWSGIFSMCFCFVSWRQIGIVSRGASLNKSGKSTDASNSRRRLLRIAVMVTVCLLLNAIATLSTSAKLSEWSRTADISLACHIKETAFSRDWETYGLNEEETTAVCSKEDANEVALGSACATDCFWYPPITTGGLTCEYEGADTFEERLEFKALAEAQFTTYDFFDACDCPCVSLIQIERPSVVMLTLAHVAQALVVMIVGVNMGFRKENMLIWKTFLRGRNTKGASSVAVSAFDVENKGYD